MEIIDSHVQLDAIHWAELEAMALAGVVAVIADSAPRTSLAPSAQWILDYFERTLGYDTERAAEFFIDTYVAVGINMIFVPPDYEKVIDALPKYLTRTRVVALGEVGLDPRSKTCPDLTKQEEILRIQLKLAREYDKSVLLHIPPIEKEKYIERYFRLIDEFNIDKSRAVITHADSTVVKMITDFGCIAGIAVQPWRKLMANDTARILQDVPLNQVLVNSDIGPRLASDILAVPKTALEMRKLGFKDTDIRKVVYENPIRVFNLSKLLGQSKIGSS